MKIQITEISVLNVEYKGERTATLETGYNYIVVAIEGFNDGQSEIILEFQNGNQDRMIYNSFVAFAKDWKIIREFKFEKCFLPIKTID